MPCATLPFRSPSVVTVQSAAFGFFEGSSFPVPSRITVSSFFSVHLPSAVTVSLIPFSASLSVSLPSAVWDTYSHVPASAFRSFFAWSSSRANATAQAGNCSRAEGDKRTEGHRTPNGPGSGLRRRMAEGRGPRPPGGEGHSSGDFRHRFQGKLAPQFRRGGQGADRQQRQEVWSEDPRRGGAAKGVLARTRLVIPRCNRE